MVFIVIEGLIKLISPLVPPWYIHVSWYVTFWSSVYTGADLRRLSGSIKKGNRKSEILLRDVEVRAIISLQAIVWLSRLLARNNHCLSGTAR